MKQEFWNELMLMRRQYAHMLEQVSSPWGLTRAEMDVLLFLENNPDLDRAADIVELRGLTKSHVSIAVKTLCKMAGTSASSLKTEASSAIMLLNRVLCASSELPLK